ncbi:riboflavin-specific deaminase C-terminal domain-containing protein [Aquisalimonas asiatica]|uniref:Riboflavin-specific deaminase C-terminal domain-containing protein n=2 Tax=Aquisalimonas asiatica TaxID=406100 RepID=A0A1H8TJN0_9GAMM|nr:riboflavin-specific deaminase C-terminal domain-containing protein [Aquisalimonas asiatica]
MTDEPGVTADTDPLGVDPAWALLQRYRAEAERPPDGVMALDGRAVLRMHDDGSWAPMVPMDDAARHLFDLYLPLVVRPRLTIAQLGQSLDGRIATASGHSRYVTGADDIRHLHRLRALVDAVVVGPGTVAADDPRLTVREVSGRHPVRVVLDPRNRLSGDYRLFRDRDAPTLLFRSDDTAPPAGVEVLQEPAADGDFEPRAVLRRLAARGLRRVLVEGGGQTVSRFLAAGTLDRLHVTVAPLVIGSGRPGLVLPAIDTMDEALRPECRQFPMGHDVLFDFRLSPDVPS